MADYDRFQWGAVAYPLTTTSGQTALQDIDPAVYQAIAFFEGIIRLHIGPRWDAEATAAGRADLVGKIVASTASFDPVPQFQEAQWALPLLAVYRTKGEYGQRTVDRSHDDGHWGIDYILPPFGPGDLERFYPFMRAISQVINDRSDYGYDPNYQSGLKAWAVAGLEYLSVSDYAFTWLTVRGAGSQATTELFPVLHLEVDVREQRALSGDPIGAPAPPPQLFDAMTGIDVTVESIDSTDPTPVDDVVNLSHLYHLSDPTMPKPKTLNVLPVGDALVTDFEAMRHHAKRYIGREHDPSHGEGGGFVPTGKTVTVPARGEFGREYIAALRNGTLAPADAETAKAAGIEFKPEKPAPKASIPPAPPAPTPADPVPAPSAK